MRPDEHKRKKNEQYKKKHGIKSKSEKAQKDVGDVKKGPMVQTSSQKIENIVPREDSSRISTETQPSRPSFQRRKVESNWDRYAELPTTEDHSERVGPDFRELLETASSATAQFSFKDEEEWANTEYDSECGLGATLLNIDCVALARDISCTPLHQRLCIEPVHFTEEQLKSFDTLAAQKKCLNTRITSGTGVQDKISPSDEPACAIKDTVPMDGDHLPTAESSKISDILDNKEIKDSKDDELDDLLNIASDLRGTIALSSQIGSGHQVHNRDLQLLATTTHGLEDDLDALLKIGSSEDSKSNQSKPLPPPSQKQVPSQNLEDLLESLLND